MNCQEVMEYMQRQLDGDLDDKEAEILMTHTRHCSNCAAMFERLQLLSSGLESLPKVMPSYSLVDAILPRLHELQASAVSDNMGSIDNKEPISTIHRREVSNRTGGRWRDRFSLRAVGGVIAAGVVVGLFLVNYNGADPLKSGSNKSNESTMTADSASSPDSTALTAEASSTTSADSPKADSEVSALEAPASKQQERVAMKNQQGEVSTKSLDPNGAPLEKHTYKEKMQENSDKVTSPNFSVSETTVPNKSNSDHTADTTDSDKMMVSSTDGKAGFAADADSEKSTNATLGVSNVINTELQANSPDGKYRAYVVDQTLQIYMAEDNTLIFQSAARTAGINSLLWSPDSKTLTYETPSADGKSKSGYVVDISTGSEQPQIK